ncbi:MAG: Hint domain-containing protein [Candidatus Woesearchaeota archaeon]
MTSKKAQLSIFIIIGIVVLLMIILAFILAFSFYNTKLRANITTASNRKSIIQQIDTTVQDCLEISAEKALNLIGKQGGYIYSYQGGLTEFPITILGTNITRSAYIGTEKYEVPFWIIRDPYDNPPGYPRFNYYGIPIMVFLKPEDVRNAPKKPITIKEQLENYAELKFKECFNISKLNQSIRAQIYEKSPAKIKVTFSRKSTRFELDYPIIVYDRQMNNKVYDSKVRFSSIYNLIRMLIERDTKNLSFMMQEDGANINSDKTLGIQNIKGTLYDMVKITDSNAKIGEKYYEFVFLRQNRNPFLQQIPTLELLIGDVYDFSPFAFDPDEDVLNLTIKNKKTGEEINDFTFKAFKKFIGVNHYTINVTDEGNLSDWQEDVEIKVMCEYYPYGDNNAAQKIKNENLIYWIFDNKIFSYNPHCCDEKTRLSFKAGETAKMLVDGKIIDCTCDASGDCDSVFQSLPEEPEEEETVCGISCLLPNTLIRLANGSVNFLSEIRIGDQVLGYDINRKIFVNNTVLSFESVEFKNFYTIITDQNFEINVTWNHFILTNSGYKRVINLKTGDTIFFFSPLGLQKTRIKDIFINQQQGVAYTILTDGSHNFFANNLLVYEH